MTSKYSRELTPMEAAATSGTLTGAQLGIKVLHPGGRQSTQHLFDLAQFEPGQQVLEIGCGVGTTAIQIADQFNCRVTAVDINPELVRRAKSNVEAAGATDRVTVEDGDMLALRYPDQSFDRVVIEAVTQFVDRPNALAEVARVCRPGAFAIDHEMVFLEKPPPEVMKLVQDSTLSGMNIDNVEGWVKLYTDAGFEEVAHVIGEEITGGPAALIRDEGLFNTLKILGNMITNKEARDSMRSASPLLRALNSHARPMVLRAKKPA